MDVYSRTTRVPHRIRVAILLSCAVVFLAVTSAITLPRLGVEHSTHCGTCHVNPNGGGMRNEYGNKEVAFKELRLPIFRELVEEHYRPPRLSESITYGFDSRHLVGRDGEVIRLQTDFYTALEPVEGLVFHFRFDEESIAENYALLTFDDEKYYVKAGRFYPVYGLRTADSMTLIRDRTGHTSKYYLDGASIGGEVFGFNLAAEVFYPDKHRMVVGHVNRLGRLLSFNYLTGVSFRQMEEVNGSTGSFPRTWSLHGGISWNRFTALGEIDFTGSQADTLVTYFSLTTRLEYGAYLVGEYNFFDGDRDVASGVDEFLRISLELFPLPYVELRPSFTTYINGFEGKEDDFIIQLHVGF